MCSICGDGRRSAGGPRGSVHGRRAHGGAGRPGGGSPEGAECLHRGGEKKVNLNSAGSIG